MLRLNTFQKTIEATYSESIYEHIENMYRVLNDNDIVAIPYTTMSYFSRDAIRAYISLFCLTSDGVAIPIDYETGDISLDTFVEYISLMLNAFEDVANKYNFYNIHHDINNKSTISIDVGTPGILPIHFGLINLDKISSISLRRKSLDLNNDDRYLIYFCDGGNASIECNGDDYLDISKKLESLNKYDILLKIN